MALSSNSLIHFTKTKTALKGILSKDFKLKYCVERIETKSRVYKFAVPMVSFCDIPLSQIEKHIKSYGNYGIGLKKEWATRIGLNPVIYLDKDSILADNSLEILSQLFLEDVKMSSLEYAELAIVDLFRYVKNYEGALERRGKLISKNYRFSDEREWRYCPEKSDLNGNFFFFNNIRFFSRLKDKANRRVSQVRLSFTPDDISYIIIKNEKEIPEFVNYLTETKGKYYSMDQVKRLTTRILTVDQIKTDF